MKFQIYTNDCIERSQGENAGLRWVSVKTELSTRYSLYSHHFLGWSKYLQFIVMTAKTGNTGLLSQLGQ